MVMGGGSLINPVLMTTGIIFNIQRYSIHDGPGIRTTVFLKGCPLSCWWCHNPEGQQDGQEIIFWENRCLGCGKCSEHCPSGAIQMKDKKPVNNKTKCTICGRCVQVCPAKAREILGIKMTVGEVIKEIEKDLIFYEESGGGVTFSGGEPLRQTEFLNDLLDCCRQRGIHTAIDTCGHLSWEFLEKVSPKVDLFLYDLKLMDSKKHQKYTRVANDTILENLKKLSLKHHNIYIRIPLISGINDDSQNIRELGRFLSSLNIVQINLLPYHNIGMDKYQRLNKSYRLSRTKPPSEEILAKISEILGGYGLKVKIRG